MGLSDMTGGTDFQTHLMFWQAWWESWVLGLAQGVSYLSTSAGAAADTPVF